MILQTVKIQMKCRIIIRVYTVCKGKKEIQTKNTIFFENYNLTPLDMYNGSEGRIHWYTKGLTGYQVMKQPC